MDITHTQMKIQNIEAHIYLYPLVNTCKHIQIQIYIMSKFITKFNSILLMSPKL